MVLGGLERDNRRLLARKPFVHSAIAPRHCLTADMHRHDQFTMSKGDVHPPVADGVGWDFFDKLGRIGRHLFPPSLNTTERFENGPRQLSLIKQLMSRSAGTPSAPRPAESTVVGLTLSAGVAG